MTASFCNIQWETWSCLEDRCSINSRFLRGVTLPATFNELSGGPSLASPTPMSWLSLHPRALCQQFIFQNHKKLIPKRPINPSPEECIASEGAHSLNSDCLHLVLLLIPSLIHYIFLLSCRNDIGIQQAGSALRSDSFLPNLATHPGQGRHSSCGKKCIIGLYSSDDHPAKGVTVSEHLALPPANVFYIDPAVLG